MSLTENWYVVAEVTQIAADQCFAVEINHHSLVIVQIQGDYYCYHDLCSHQDVKLSEFGVIMGDEIQCNAHGGRFQGKDGLPCRFPASQALKSFPCRLRSDGKIEVQLTQS